jgi:hypothetical protein
MLRVLPQWQLDAAHPRATISTAAAVATYAAATTDASSSTARMSRGQQ